MILTFNDDRADLHLWAPRSDSDMRIDTGSQTHPEQAVLTSTGTGNVVTWPKLAENRVRNEAIPVGTDGAFELRDNTREQIDAWLLECCKLAAKHFGAATATYAGISYTRPSKAKANG